MSLIFVCLMFNHAKLLFSDKWKKQGELYYLFEISQATFKYKKCIII